LEDNLKKKKKNGRRPKKNDKWKKTSTKNKKWKTTSTIKILRNGRQPLKKERKRPKKEK
jgi:hypothetical protein